MKRKKRDKNVHVYARVSCASWRRTEDAAPRVSLGGISEIAGKGNVDVRMVLRSVLQLEVTLIFFVQ